MEADAKSFIGFLAPLAIIYMTWSAVTTDVTVLKGPDLKSVNVGQISGAPMLPSADTDLRDPFTPEGAVSLALARAGAASKDGAAAKDELPLHLDGTVIAGKLRFAVINGTRVIEGDFFRGQKLERVEADRVVLTGGKTETVLPLEIAKSDAIHPMAVSAPAVNEGHQPSATGAATGGMGGTGGMSGAAGGTAKSSPAKKASPGGMGAKQAPRAGGMGH